MPDIKILLVDDTNFFLELEKSFLQCEEFKLLTAHSGKEAIAQVKKYRPDLIFMDLYMPEMNGDEACRLIKSDPDFSQTPVIMVTAGSNSKDLERCGQSGCDDILLKPIDQNRFVEVVGRFLRLNNRGASRVEARFRISYGEDQQKRLQNYSVNISPGGCFIKTEDLLQPNTDLRLELILPGAKKKIACKGRVAWINHPQKIINTTLPVGMGVQFLDLAEEDQDAIREYIQAQKMRG